MREIVTAIFYVLRGGIVWSLLPKDFPPGPKAYRWFARFHDDGTWERIEHHLGDARPQTCWPRSKPEVAPGTGQVAKRGSRPYGAERPGVYDGDSSQEAGV
jgi:putative transposase